MAASPKLFCGLVVICLFSQTLADVAKFFYSNQEDYCTWGNHVLTADNNTARGGVCAYVPSIDRVYACPAPDNICWTFAQTCAQGANPGINQIKCTNAYYNVSWCCPNEETCTLNQDQYNVCWSPFQSPNKGVSVADALAAEYSAIPSASITATAFSEIPSVFSTSTFAAQANGATSSGAASSSTAATTISAATQGSSRTASAGSADTTSSHSSTPKSRSGPSGGEIAGIVIGVIAVLAIVCATIVFLVVFRRRTRANKNQQSSNPEKPNCGNDQSPPNANKHEGYYGQGHQDQKSQVMQQQHYTGLAEAPTDSTTFRAEMPGSQTTRHELQ